MPRLNHQTYEKGNISKYLAGLQVGDSVQVRGPKGKFVYRKDLSPHLLMIAGGTGITPMYQIIKSSLRDPTDPTQLALVYANVEEGDIRECKCGMCWAPVRACVHACVLACVRRKCAAGDCR